MSNLPILFKVENDKVVDQLKIDTLLEFLNAKIYAEDLSQHKILCEKGPYTVLTADLGKKYIKIVERHPNHGNSAYVHSFIDYQGNIYKAASWRAPAKHIRGTVWDKDYSWGKGWGKYGGTYLK
jgi:hypothetical protein